MAYNLEPPPTGKALLSTTAGDIVVELWAKQTPLACRSFLQHCLDGYYDGTLFHRLVPGFIVQGGDPTGTGDGGEAAFPEGTFADEFHSRLKWNRRGLLGMANESRPNSNGSQFFFSLGPDCAQLAGRNTLFGRVVGDTVFNLVKMGEAELADGPNTERPLYPTKIIGTEVLSNPFQDMTKRNIRQVATISEPTPKVAKARRPAKQLLSFGDDDLDLPGPQKRSARPEPKSPPRLAPTVKAPSPARDLSVATVRSDSESPAPEDVKRVSSLLDRTNQQIAEMKASMKRGHTIAPENVKPQSALERLIPKTAVRGKKRKLGTATQTLQSLQAFRAKLEAGIENKDAATAKNTNGKPETENEDGEAALCDLHFIANCQSCAAWDENGEGDRDDPDDGGWMSHQLSFAKDRLGKDLTWKRKAEEELVVIDPRDKAMNLKQEQQQRMRNRQRQNGGAVWRPDAPPTKDRRP